MGPAAAVTGHLILTELNKDWLLLRGITRGQMSSNFCKGQGQGMGTNLVQAVEGKDFGGASRRRSTTTTFVLMCLDERSYAYADRTVGFTCRGIFD